MEKETNNYEIGFLVKAEDGRAGIVKILKNHKAEIAGEGAMTKIKLAYPIKKEVFAYFGYLYFSGSSEEIKEIDKELRFTPEVLRFIVISKSVLPRKREEVNKKEPAVKEAAAKPVKEKPSVSTEDKVKTAVVSRRSEHQELSNEELEKKLEEILK